MSALPNNDEPIIDGKALATTRWYEFFADKDAYTPYTPTITAGSGTFTTVSATGRYKKRGRTVWIEITVTITTVGTAAGAVIATLPVIAGNGAYVLAGRETAAVNTALTGLIAAAGSTVSILEYDGTTIAASSRTLVISGSYESAS